MKKQFNAIFISDIHLGFRGSNPQPLTDFLKTCHADHIYLLGDIIDIWAFKENHYWHATHTELLKTLLKKAKKSKIYYIVGNHDYDLRKLDGIEFGNISFHREKIHHCINGNELLCVHGDQFDSIIQENKFIVYIGCFLYDKLILISHYVSKLRSLAGRVH